MSRQKLSVFSSSCGKENLSVTARGRAPSAGPRACVRPLPRAHAPRATRHAPRDADKLRHGGRTVAERGHDDD